jgi:AraC-like DNA-binding protein
MELYYHIPRMHSYVQIFSIQYNKEPGGWSYPTHRHPIFELLYCESGQLLQVVNGVAYTLHPGDAVLVPSDVYHTLTADEDSVFFNFHFDIDPLEFRTLFQHLPNPMLTAGLPPNMLHSFTGWMNLLIDSFRKSKGHDHIKENPFSFNQMFHYTYGQLKLQSSVIEFVIFLAEIVLRKAEETKTSLQPMKAQIAHEVSYLLESNWDDNVQISQLAKKLNVHRTYISNCFKSVYGISPKVYSAQVRIRKAKELLRRTVLPIADISDRLAFSSTSHFCRTFRSMVGCTPFQYRSSHSEEVYR